MTRYYTVCAFTDTVGSKYDPKYRYRTAPPAFVFHDSDGNLDVTDILKPLFRLTQFYEPDNQALVVKIDENTLAATFSLRGFPVPTRELDWQGKPKGDPYPSGDDFQCWAIRNTKSLSLAPVPLNVGQIYDDCLHLPRHADQCPCKLIETGECYSSNLEEVLPEEFKGNALSRSHTELPRDYFKRAEFKKLAGFEYVTPGLTTEADFAAAVRPWDAIDFSVIDDRAATFKERGQQRKADNLFRKTHCSKCEFKHTRYVKGKPQPTDCGSMRVCQGHSTAEDVDSALSKFFTRSHFNHMQGFTQAERDYLIRLGGQTTKARIFSSARRTNVRYGYFGYNYNTRDWSYLMFAAAGDLTRCESFSSYEKLRALIPGLPEKPTPARCTYLQKLACVIYGIRLTRRGNWGTMHERCSVTLHENSVYSEFSNSRYVTASQRLYLDPSDRARWAQYAFDYSFCRIPQYSADKYSMDPFF